MGALRSLALAAGLVMAFATPASAAGWLPAVNLSTPSTSTPGASVVASDAAGESFATWSDTDGANTRIMLATHAPGGPWSASAPISDPGQNATIPSLAVSSNGFAAIAWLQSDGTINRVLVARRAPGGAFGAPAILSDPGSNSSFPIVGVDRSGNVQVGWTSSTDNIIHTRRFMAATGSFTGTTDLTPAINPSNQLLLGPTLVMSPTGVATIAWYIDTDATSATLSLNVQSRTQDANGNWLPLVSHSTTSSLTQSGRPQLAVADDGAVTLVWMEYTTTGCGLLCTIFVTSVVRGQTRSVAGTWGASQILSDPALISDNPTVATAPAGETTVVWVEAAAKAVKALTRTVGGAFPVASAATIITPQDRAINSGTFFFIPSSSLHITSNATGTVVTFNRTDGSNYLASAVHRLAGGAWPNPLTGLATLSATGSSSGLDVNAGIDGFGNVVTSWTRDNVIQSATLDLSPPTLTGLNVPVAGTTGQPVAMSATTFDVWQALDARLPNWSFGDGATAAGGSVSHVFSAPGTYTVTVAASDTAGNVSAPATRQIVITSPPPPPVPPLPTTTVTSPKTKITWRSGKLRNSSVTLTGTVGSAASLTITVIRHAGKRSALKSMFAAKAGTWSRTLKLPASLAPGRYDVKVAGPVVQPSQTSFTLRAPASGIIKRTYASGPRRGPAVTTLGHSSELWAHFSFAVLPKKGQKITTQWILPSRKKLAANTRPRTALVEAQVKDLTGKALPKGRWRCVIKVGRTVLATLNVRLR